jgi:hypothetical protein
LQNNKLFIIDSFSRRIEKMAQKPLLTESEIRSFMKLAELRPIGDERIAEMYGTAPGARDEEEGEEEEAGMELDMGAEEEEAPEMDAEMDMDMDMGDEPAMDMGADSKMVSIEDFMSALESALEDITGEPVSTEMDGEEMDMGAEEEEEAELPAPEMDMEMGAEEEEEPMMEQEDLVNEVARRVAARLQAQDNKDKMVDDLAERIMKRLAK